MNRSENEGPIVPVELRDVMEQGELSVVHDELVRAGVPDVEPLSAEGVRGYRILPNGDFDESRAALFFPSHTHGFAPYFHIKAAAIQRLACPDRQLVVVPNNGFGHDSKSYGFSEREARQTAEGDFTPLIDRALRLLEVAHVEEVDVNGDSLGGSVALQAGVRASDYYNVRTVCAKEPASFVPGRTARQLAGDFRKGGLRDVNRAILDSALPALTETQGVGSVALPFPTRWKQATELVRAGCAAASATNKALQHGMTEVDSKSHVNALVAAGIPVDIFSAPASLIAPTESFKELPDAVHHIVGTIVDAQGVEMYTYGHGLVDNVIANGLMSRITASRR